MLWLHSSVLEYPCMSLAAQAEDYRRFSQVPLNRQAKRTLVISDPPPQRCPLDYSPPHRSLIMHDQCLSESVNI